MQTVGRFLLYYIAWILSAALATFAAYWVWMTILNLMVITLTNAWYWNFIRMATAILLGLFWIIFVIAIESYFRRWLKDDWQPWAALKILGILAAVSVVAYGVNTIFL